MILISFDLLLLLCIIVFNLYLKTFSHYRRSDLQLHQFVGQKITDEKYECQFCGYVTDVTDESRQYI